MPSRVLIVGGGIAGLTLAALLRRLPSNDDGFEVTLVERANAWAPLGAGIVLAGNALRLLDRLAIVPALAEGGVELERMRIADASGYVLSENVVVAVGEGGRDEYSARAIAAHRAVLHQALLGAFSGSDSAQPEILLGCEPLSFRARGEVGVEAVEVELSNGLRLSFDYVVGADGVHSRVRREILGEAAGDPFRYAGYTCWRSVVDMVGHPLADARTAWELWGRGKRFGLVPIGGGRVYFYACVNAPQSDPHCAAIDRPRFVDLFRELGGPVPDVLEALRSDSDSVLFHDDIGEVRLERWSRERMILIGDAAHASTPNLGQGASLAIEDAVVVSDLLDRALASGALGEVASEFERLRRPRVERLQSRAGIVGRVAQWESGMARWLRDRLVAATPARLATAQVRHIVDESIAPRIYSEPGRSS